MIKSIAILFPFSLLLIMGIGFSCSDPETEKPNIILIMADDMGASDIGCYGSEIKTPNIDYLASQGLRFTTFYNMAKCNPTRSTLLTGLYTGGDGAVHLADITRSAGYYNIMAGKEHFDGWVPDYCSADKVFDDAFYFKAITEYFLPPKGKFRRPFILNGQILEADEIEYEKAPMYKTDFITGYAVRWLEDVLNNDKPFFLYLPYHVAHYPLQARPEDIEKYRGTYMKGWDQLREERFERMQQLGVLPDNAKLSPPENNLNMLRKPIVPDYNNYYPWESLSDEKKDSLDLEMAVFAAMVDRMDQNIGRVIEKLREHDKLENTLILFLVDNGSCPFYSNLIEDVQPGPANSYWSLRTSWANLGNTPYRQFKQAGYEGGCHTPFIAFWPAQIKPNTITQQPGHIVDILPTFMDILDISYPDSIHGYPTIPLHGASLLPILEGKEREEPEFFISGLNNFRMYRSGDYKIVRMNGGDWKLYNVKEDPTELIDLSAENPEILQKMASDYKEKMQSLRADKS